jgi:P-type E1-E2 ATPase
VPVESGDRVPADLRLLQAANLAIDESFLTGETIAPEKSVAPVAEDAPIGDRLNLAFAGSTVQTGRGLGVTAATDIATQVGRIAVSVAFAEAAKPPLLLRMEKFAQQISYFVGAAIILLAVIGVYRNMSILDVFFFAVALAVSAIPEGLPVAMTVALSIGVQRMARRNVIVRKLPAVEGLGSCTVIASDKTGTLTVNQQTVRALWLPAHGRLMVPGGSYPGAEAEEPVLPGPAAQVEDLARASALCNEARLERLESGWQGHDDAMDVALLVLAHMEVFKLIRRSPGIP